jgi:hypothetical protein
VPPGDRGQRLVYTPLGGRQLVSDSALEWIWIFACSGQLPGSATLSKSAYDAVASTFTLKSGTLGEVV